MLSGASFDFGSCPESESKSVQESIDTNRIDVRNTQAFTDLLLDIKNCDEILESMGEMLTGFQQDLGKLNGEIETLQLQSQLMSTRLKNRTVNILVLA